MAILSNTQILVQTWIMGWAFNEYECCQTRISSILKLNAKRVLFPVTKELVIFELKHNWIKSSQDFTCAFQSLVPMN